MAGRRDLFQSYQFMVQRVISGIVLRETDPVQTPLRRMSGSGFASIMIAIVALAGTGLIGVFFPSGNKTWQSEPAVIVEKETGATFVYLDLTDDDKDNKLLYPTVNFTSAALLVSTTDVVGVSHASLLEVQRGPMLGISDAPESVPPEPGLMLGDPWTLCSLPARTISGEEVPNTALVVGRDISQGKAIEEEAVLVRDIERNTLHFVWNGHQYPVPNEGAALVGLSLGLEPQVEVGTAWLNAVPSGLPLQPFPVSGRGAPSAAFPGAIVGEIRYVESADNNKQYYQVATDRLQEVTQVQASLLLADPELRYLVYGGQQPQARLLASADANRATRVELPPTAPTDPPADQPEMVGIDERNPTICAAFRADEPTPEISVEAAVEGAEGASDTERRTEEGTVLADRVQVEPGYGTIVEALASPTAEVGTRYLVTDEGRRYPLASAEVQATLGYSDFTPVRLPASLIERVPSGSALDPRAARDPLG